MTKQHPMLCKPLCPTINSRVSTQAPTSKVVVAFGEPDETHTMRDELAKLGYEVHMANTEGDVRRLVGKVRPSASVISTSTLLHESGWLTCRKLTMERPEMPVVLVSQDPTPTDHRLAEFVGAAAVVTASSVIAAVKAAVVSNPVVCI
jgi:DNA-binding response OmpR family regulator